MSYQILAKLSRALSGTKRFGATATAARESLVTKSVCEKPILHTRSDIKKITFAYGSKGSARADSTASIAVPAPRVVPRAKRSTPQKAVDQANRSPARSVTFANQIETRIEVASDESKSNDVEGTACESGSTDSLHTKAGRLTDAFLDEIFSLDLQGESEKPPVAKPKPATEVSQPVFCSMESIEIAQVVQIGEGSKALKRQKLRRENASVKTKTRQQPRAKEANSKGDLLPRAEKSALTFMLKRALRAALAGDIPSFVEDAGLRLQTLANQSYLQDKDSVDTALRALLALDPEKQTEQNDIVALLWHVARCGELASQSTTARTTDWVRSDAIANRDVLDAKVDAYLEKSLSITLDPLADVKL